MNINDKNKNKLGFTLIELLSVIIVLSIVISLAVIGQIKIKKGITNSYYDNVKSSILLSANNYFNYNENNNFSNGNSAFKVTVQSLVDGKYMEKIVNQKGELCDLQNSYVLAYLNESKNTEYVICLKCNDEYDNTDSDKCKIN